MDDVMKDNQAMKTVNWKRYGQDRSKWKPIVQQVKTYVEL
jgi:hypothetical protein